MVVIVFQFTGFNLRNIGVVILPKDVRLSVALLINFRDQREDVHACTICFQGLSCVCHFS